MLISSFGNQYDEDVGDIYSGRRAKFAFQNCSLVSIPSG